MLTYVLRDGYEYFVSFKFPLKIIFGHHIIHVSQGLTVTHLLSLCRCFCLTMKCGFRMYPC